MNEQRFTPGPWKVLEHSWCNTSIVADGFDHGICGLDINHATEESQEADGALMAANATLIAAAPCLLAACQALISYDESDDANGLLFMQKYADAVNKARAAIARALPQVAGDPNV